MKDHVFNRRHSISPKETKLMDTEQLRENFLIAQLFEPDKLLFTYSHYDRFMVGGLMPLSKKIKLEPIPELLKSSSFLDRRELGIINIGGDGLLEVEDKSYRLGYKDALYIGKGAQEVYFRSIDPQQPAKFYLNSTAAQHSYPTKQIHKADAKTITIGNENSANRRVIHQLLFRELLDTCQLQMGLTELISGSVWNTMPAHTHERRMEVYFYFELPQDQAISHFMGEPSETRHLWVHNEQAIISPPWSIHAGVGTNNYSFIWGMAGENLDYADMDLCAITDLK